MTVQHLDFGRLTGQLLTDFKRTLQQSIATEAGGDVNASDVMLDLTAGSVKVAATIPAMNGTVADDLSSGLGDLAQFSKKMALHIMLVEGIDAAATGPISVTDVSAESAAVGASGFDPSLFLKWGAASIAVFLLALLVLLGCRKGSQQEGPPGLTLLEGGGSGDEEPAEPESFGPRRSPEMVSTPPLSKPLTGGESPRSIGLTSPRSIGSPGAASSEVPPQPFAKAKAKVKAKAKAAVATRLPRSESPSPRIAPVPHSAPQSRSTSRSSRAGAKAAATALLLGSTAEEPSEGEPSALNRAGAPAAPSGTSAPVPDVASQEMTISTMEISSPPGGGAGDDAGPGAGGPGSSPGGSGLPEGEADFLAFALEMGISESVARQAWASNTGDADAALAAALH